MLDALMAGLLTFPPRGLPVSGLTVARFARRVQMDDSLVQLIHSNGITVAGTAPDLHRIPFSSPLREPSLFQRVLTI